MKNIFRHLSADLPSGIVVFLVAIPLCLGVAVASGVNELSGIVAGVVGGIIVGALSGSQLSVSGPAAGLTAIVAAAVLKLPAIEAFFLAVVIAGVVQIIMGLLKLGVIGDYIPNSVIKGMLAGIGVILILKQLPHLVGYDKNYEGDESFIESSGGNTFSSILQAINHITPLAMIIGILGLAIMIFFDTKWMKSKKIFQILNGPLLVVLIGVLLVQTGGGLSTDHLVNLPVADSLSDFFGLLTFPDWQFLNNPDVWITAITLALVASLETLLGIEAVDKIDPEKRATPNNRELIAQGSGNIVSGMLGGLPLTSVIVRSSANINAGARTKMSTIFHGSLILVSVLFLPAVLNMIPKAALAAVLVFTGYKLAKVSLFREYYKKGWHQFMPFVVTLTSIVLTDLLTGVMIGLVLAVFYIMRDNFRSSVYMVQDKNNFMLRLRKDISFFSKPVLKKKLAQIPDNSSVLIDVSRAEFIDLDITDTIKEFTEQAEFRNITVKVSGSFYNGSSLLWQKNNKEKITAVYYEDADH